MSANTNRRRSGPAVLLTLSALLIASGVLRFSLGFGPALAEEFSRSVESNTEIPSALELSDLEKMLTALQAKEAELDQQAREIELRLAVLSLAEVEFEKTTRRLEAAQKDLRGTLNETDRAAENDLARLTSVYDNMAPDSAVPLFEKMDAGFAAGFLARMRPDAAAEILSGLEPDKAYAISVILAGRNALAGQIDR